jgi:hypothetical protein
MLISTTHAVLKVLRLCAIFHLSLLFSNKEREGYFVLFSFVKSNQQGNGYMDDTSQMNGNYINIPKAHTETQTSNITEPIKQPAALQ